MMFPKFLLSEASIVDFTTMRNGLLSFRKGKEGSISEASFKSRRVK